MLRPSARNTEAGAAYMLRSPAGDAATSRRRMARRGALAVILIALLCPCVTAGDSDAKLLYLPPSLEDRVIYYNSFANGLRKPEINSIEAKLRGAGQQVDQGLVGKACKAPEWQ